MEIKNFIYCYTKYCGTLSIHVDSEWRSYHSSAYASTPTQVIGVRLYDYHDNIHVKVKQDANKQYFIDVYYPNLVVMRSKCSSVKITYYEW